MEIDGDIQMEIDRDRQVIDKRWMEIDRDRQRQKIEIDRQR